MLLDLIQMLVTALGGFWRAYCRQLTRKPLLTKCATGVVCSVLGDAIGQYSDAKGQAPVERERGRSYRISNYDWWRTARLCFYSAVIGTPIGHYWFAFLDKTIFPGRMGHPLAATTKVLLDQLLMAPIGTALFFYVMKCLEGQPEAAMSSVRDKLRPTMMANWMLWPVANLINFAFVPSDQRILYVGVISIFWTSYISHMAAKKPKHHQSPPSSPDGPEIKSRVEDDKGLHKRGSGVSSQEQSMMMDRANRRVQAERLITPHGY